MALPEGIYEVHIIPADSSQYADTTITVINVNAKQNTDIGTIIL